MSVRPSIHEVAFDCPHCGAFTSQTWFSLVADNIGQDRRTPLIITRERLTAYLQSSTVDEEEKRAIAEEAKKALSGLVHIERMAEAARTSAGVTNLHLSQCYVCEKIAVWVHDRLMFPTVMEADPPNPDLPDDVRFDYEEAGRIVNQSPRSAAALLRLAIQKLCAALGEKGKNIDADIASLVQKGLLPVVQRSLDALRVIGNEAVHPGVMDLKDDRDTANELFALVNIIADQMISRPKQAEAVYAKLPQSKRDAIEKRDGKSP
jgi:hypothetical protein